MCGTGAAKALLDGGEEEAAAQLFTALGDYADAADYAGLPEDYEQMQTLWRLLMQGTDAEGR